MKRNVQELDVEETIANVARVKVMKKPKKRANLKTNHNLNQKNQKNHAMMVKDSEVEVETNVVVVAAEVVIAVAVIAVIAVAVIVVIAVVIVVIVVVVEGEEEVVAAAVEEREKKGMAKDKKTRVDITHGRVKSRATVPTNSKTETPNLLVLKLEINSRRAKNRELQKLQEGKERKVSLKVKGRLSAVVEVAAEVVVEVVAEVAAEAVMAQCQATLPTRQSKPKIDNSEDPMIKTGVEQSEVTP